MASAPVERTPAVKLSRELGEWERRVLKDLARGPLVFASGYMGAFADNLVSLGYASAVPMPTRPTPGQWPKGSRPAYTQATYTITDAGRAALEGGAP